MIWYFHFPHLTRRNGNILCKNMIYSESRMSRFIWEYRVNRTTKSVGEILRMLDHFLAKNLDCHTLIADIEIPCQNSWNILIMSIEVFNNSLCILPYLESLQTFIRYMKMSCEKSDRSVLCLYLRDEKWKRPFPGMGIAFVFWFIGKRYAVVWNNGRHLFTKV